MNRNRRDLRQPLRRVCEQLRFVGGDGVDTDRGDVVDGRGEADGTGNIRRARFEALRNGGVGGLLEAHRAGSCHYRPGTVAARRAAPPCHTVRRCRLDRTACGRRTHRSRSPIPARSTGEVRRCLRAIDDHRHVGVGARVDQRPQRIDGSQRVRHVRHGDELGARAQELRVRVEP